MPAGPALLPSKACRIGRVGGVCDRKAHESDSLFGPLEGLLGAGADREHRAGAVCSRAERAEDMARLAVDPDVLDAFDRARLLRALDLFEHALRRDEEAHDRAAD